MPSAQLPAGPGCCGVRIPASDRRPSATPDPIRRPHDPPQAPACPLAGGSRRPDCRRYRGLAGIGGHGHDLAAPRDPHRAAADPDQLPRRLGHGAQLDLRRRLLERPPQRATALLHLGHRRELRAEQAVHARRAGHGPCALGCPKGARRTLSSSFTIEQPGVVAQTEFAPIPGSPADVQSFQSRSELQPGVVTVHQAPGVGSAAGLLLRRRFSAPASGGR